ncbi:MAG: hypothetical protein LBI17_03605 [Rickettsiales bacterium]|jgi:hypothetical protein|nr:hypothetical protein [Rickettsiales bacterium]
MGKISRSICIIALLAPVLAGSPAYSQGAKARANASSKKAGDDAGKKKSAKETDAGAGKKTAKKSDDELVRKGAGSVKQAPQRNVPKNEKPSPNSKRDSSARLAARAAVVLANEPVEQEAVPEDAESAPMSESAAADEAAIATDAYAAYEESASDTPATAAQESQWTDVGTAVDESYADISQGVETYEQAQAEAPMPVQAQAAEPAAPAAETVVAVAAAPKFDCSDTTVDETSQEWEDFNYCMRQGCAGGDEQPPNVQCYRQATYDTVYFNCRELFDDRSKQELFSCHMKNKIIPQEKQTACKERGGTWASATGRCSISIKFSRGSPCNDGMTVTKVVDEKNQQFVCSYDTFGLGECYKENKEAKSQAEIAKWTGLASIGLGLATATVGVIQGISGAKGAYNPDKCTANGGGCNDTATHTDKVIGGIAGGLTGGAGSIAEGAISLAQSKEMAKMKGDQFLEGRCQVPIGLKEDGVSPDYQTIREGGYILLGW